jgi:hypothetical protein
VARQDQRIDLRMARTVPAPTNSCVVTGG